MRRKTIIPREMKLAGGYIGGTAAMALVGSKLPGAAGRVVSSGATTAAGMAGPIITVAGTSYLLKTMKKSFPTKKIKFAKRKIYL